MYFIDRDPELISLRSAIDNCFSGRFGILLVESPVGCGKTEFLETAAGWARESGATVLRGAGHDLERELPLGVLRQLLRDAPPGAIADPADGGTIGPAEASHSAGMQRFATDLCELSRSAPLVICVDDLHHVDSATLRYLLHSARHLRQARILLILAESLQIPAQDPDFGIELLRQPAFKRIRLTRLSEQGVAAMAAADPELPRDRVSPHAAHPLHQELYQVSGGNPLLLTALLEEYRTPRFGPPRDEAARAPEESGPYVRAVLTCLRRSGPQVVELSEALAVLGSASTPALAASLLDIRESAAAQGVHGLNLAGITAEGRIRHPVVETAILDSMEPSRRRRLHRIAAGLLHRSGGSASAVAEQLLAVRHTAEPWAAAVLRDAATEALAADDVHRALECLSLRYEAADCPTQRTEIRSRQVATTWRISPYSAEQSLTGLLDTLPEEDISVSQLTDLAKLLTAQGRIDEAAGILERLPKAATPARPDAAPRPAEPPAALWSVPAGGKPDIATAERLLTHAVLTEETVEPILQALRTLAHSERPDRVLPWCHSMRVQAADRGAVGWEAAVGLIAAKAQVRQGSLREAAEQAESALEALREQGSLLSYGLRTLLGSVQTAMGRLDAAARQLNQPVPDGLYRSIHGLAHLQARGRHHLATQHPQAALSDFLDAGRLMKRWGLDRPVLLPWRTDAAGALLQLGDLPQARRLVQEQLTGEDAKHPWVHGITLRLHAATSDAKLRPRLLSEAVDELRRCGDRLELARAMADLGTALQESGERARAAMVTRRAWQLAKDCGAEALCESIAPGHARSLQLPSEEAAEEPCGALAKLSESETRVAMLASYGYTNREIAMKLFVTVSTVEQHLTRVYRKLNIARRQDLSMAPQLSAAKIA